VFDGPGFVEVLFCIHPHDPQRVKTCSVLQSSVVTAAAALAVKGMRLYLEQAIILAALDIEGFAANPSPYHHMVCQIERLCT